MCLLLYVILTRMISSLGRLVIPVCFQNVVLLLSAPNQLDCKRDVNRKGAFSIQQFETTRQSRAQDVKEDRDTLKSQCIFNGLVEIVVGHSLRIRRPYKDLLHDWDDPNPNPW